MSSDLPNRLSLDPSVQEIVISMEKAALKAAKLILTKLEQGSGLLSWRKGDDTVVTEADIESQALLVEALKGELPLVCEEDPSSHGILETSDSYLLIDPLDGTTSARRFGNGIGGQVGYGPIIGFVHEARLLAGVFVNIPMRKCFSAVMGFGCESFPMDDIATRTKLAKVEACPTEKSAVLFYAGKRGELEALDRIRKYSSIENYYRFGGFANDATRVALNFEQLQLQFSVKAWDLPAVLIPHEAGCKVLLHPLENAVELTSYRPQLENPLLLGQKNLIDEVLSLIRDQK